MSWLVVACQQPHPASSEVQSDRNPYQTSTLSAIEGQPCSRNRIGEIGFTLVVIALVSLWLARLSAVACCLFFCCVPGTILSFAGLCRVPRRLAGWGATIGTLLCLQIPTMLLPVIRRQRKQVITDGQDFVEYYDVVVPNWLVIGASAIFVTLIVVAVLLAIRSKGKR